MENGVIKTDDPVSIVVLAYNEAETIEKEINLFYDKIITKLPGSEFIIAEDGSTDGTTEIIENLVKTKGIIHVTSKERLGYRKALLNAIKATRNSFIFMSDTGLKQDPDDFWKLYEIRNDYDLIVGRKTHRKDQFYRQIFTMVYNYFIRVLFSLKNVHDCDSGFRLFKRKVAEELYLDNKLFFKELMSSEIVIRLNYMGMRYTEVPVSYKQRIGESRSFPVMKLPKIIFAALKNLWLLKKELSEKPIR